MNAKFLARITCICLSCAINISLLSVSAYKIYHKKEKQSTICHKLLMLYLLFGFLTPFYNIAYRFVITEELCFISDTIEEILVLVTRGIIVLFYIIRLKTIFHGSFAAINDYILKALLIILILYSIIIPCLWIPQQQVTPYTIPHLGVYCSNTGDLWIIVLYYVLDFIFTLFLTFLFVHRLHIFSQNDPDDAETTLYTLVNKTIVLTTISVISTWIIMYPSYLSTTDFLSELRWFYPIDYGINGLCLFFMFKWKFECIQCSKNNQINGKQINTKNNKRVIQVSIETNQVSKSKKNRLPQCSPSSLPQHSIVNSESNTTVRAFRSIGGIPIPISE